MMRFFLLVLLFLPCSLFSMQRQKLRNDSSFLMRLPYELRGQLLVDIVWGKSTFSQKFQRFLRLASSEREVVAETIKAYMQAHDGLVGSSKMRLRYDFEYLEKLLTAFCTRFSINPIEAGSLMGIAPKILWFILLEEYQGPSEKPTSTSFRSLGKEKWRMRHWSCIEQFIAYARKIKDNSFLKFLTHVQTPDQRTILFEAVYDGQVEIVKTLLEYGADPLITPKTDTLHYPLLTWAAHQGHTKIVELLLLYKVDPNARANGNQTALHIIAGSHLLEFQHLTIVELLFAAGANPQLIDDQGYTPLMRADSTFKLLLSLRLREVMHAIAHPNPDNPTTEELRLKIMAFLEKWQK